MHRSVSHTRSMITCLLLSILGLAACGDETKGVSDGSSRDSGAGGDSGSGTKTEPRLPGFGVDYLNYTLPTGLSGNEEVRQTSWKLADLDALKAPIVRQMQGHDLTWDHVEKTNDAFTYAAADELIRGTTIPFVGSLFYESGAKSDPRKSPWSSDSSDDRRDYVTKVVARYADVIDFWEIGNENTLSFVLGKLSPEDYASVVMEAAPVIHAQDPKAAVILSGMHNLADGVVDGETGQLTWLGRVLTAVGTPDQYIQVVDAHLYGDWYRIPEQVRAIKTTLSKHGSSAQILVGENGVSSEAGNAKPLAGTDNKKQAAMVFIRMALAVGAGAAQSTWFSHINDFGDDYSHGFQGYGTVWHDVGGEIVHKPSWYSLQLLFKELSGFTSAELVSEGDGNSGQGNYVVKFRVGDSDRFVAWNSVGGSYVLSGLTASSVSIRSTVCDTASAMHGNTTDEWPSLDGANNPVFVSSTATVQAGAATLQLTATPILVTVN